MTLRGLHTHGILILFREWVSCVSFLTGWYSGSQPNASLGSVPSLLDPWLYPYFYITLSFLVLNQWCPPLMGSIEPFSPFLVCFPCSVATDSFQVLLVLYILQTKPFFFSWEFRIYSSHCWNLFFPLCLSQPLCLTRATFDRRLASGLASPGPHSHRQVHISWPHAFSSAMVVF